MQEQPCALRALSLCDGHEVEDQDHALGECLCVALKRAEDRCAGHIAEALRAYRQGLIEQTMAAPPLPLQP